MKHLKIVAGIVICLQILSGCADTTGKSGVRVAKGTSKDANVAPYDLFDVKNTPEYKEYIESFYTTLNGGLHIQELMNTYKWGYITRQPSNPEKQGVILDATGKKGLSFLGQKVVRINRAAYEALSNDERGLLLMKQVVIATYLEKYVRPKAMSDSKPLNENEVDGEVQKAITDFNNSEAGIKSAFPTTNNNQNVANNKNGAVNNQKPAVKRVNNPAVTVITVKPADYVKISEAAEWLVANARTNYGRTATVEEIRTKLQSLDILKKGTNSSLAAE